MEFFKRRHLPHWLWVLVVQHLALPNITILATGGTIAGGGDSATKSNYTICLHITIALRAMERAGTLPALLFPETEERGIP